MNNERTSGYLTMVKTISSGGSVHGRLNDFAAHEGPYSDLFRGAVDCVISCVDALKQAGFGIRNDHPEIDSFLQADAITQTIVINRALKVGDTSDLGILCDAVDALRMFLKFESPAPQPVKVIVDRMPIRETVTQVERDYNGNILIATQTERDAPGGVAALA